MWLGGFPGVERFFCRSEAPSDDAHLFLKASPVLSGTGEHILILISATVIACSSLLTDQSCS